MALPTQPNGSSIVPLAGAPRIPGASFTVVSQSELTLIQNANGGKETTAISVINN